MRVGSGERTASEGGLRGREAVRCRVSMPVNLDVQIACECNLHLWVVDRP